MAQEFVMLAHTFEPMKHDPSSWYASEKLDGMRCYYDGGITRGLPTKDVPWANTVKDSRYLLPQYSTGLWSRYGKPIQAPDSFLDKLPKHPLDGELWMGRGMFQRLMSTVKDLNPGPDWANVKYCAFDVPSYQQIFHSRKLTGKYSKDFHDVMPWIARRALLSEFLYASQPFEATLRWLKRNLQENDVVKLHPQEQLPYGRASALTVLEEKASKIVEAGGEGVMLRSSASYWAPKRVHTLLKYKPCKDAEATVIGFTWGRETELGSKLLGKMGALIVDWDGVIFKLSGFTDEEREVTPYNLEEAIANQGEVAKAGYSVVAFPFESTVTFTYRELTDGGVPKEARYLRRREE